MHTSCLFCKKKTSCHVVSKGNKYANFWEKLISFVTSVTVQSGVPKFAAVHSR